MIVFVTLKKSLYLYCQHLVWFRVNHWFVLYSCTSLYPLSRYNIVFLIPWCIMMDTVVGNTDLLISFSQNQPNKFVSFNKNWLW